MVTDLLVIVACAAACLVALMVVFNPEPVRDAALRVARATRVLPPEPPDPTGPPIDVLARDLHRLAGLVRTQPPSRSHTVRCAALAAYDDVLVQACAALDVPDTLGVLRPGTERDAERLRIEWLLHERGLDW